MALKAIFGAKPLLYPLNQTAPSSEIPGKRQLAS
jgi:hypothetical protein